MKLQIIQITFNCYYKSALNENSLSNTIFIQNLQTNVLHEKAHFKTMHLIIIFI